MTGKPTRKEVTYLRAPTDAEGLYRLNRIIGEEMREYAEELEKTRRNYLDAVRAAHDLYRRPIKRFHKK